MTENKYKMSYEKIEFNSLHLKQNFLALTLYFGTQYLPDGNFSKSIIVSSPQHFMRKHLVLKALLYTSLMFVREIRCWLRRNATVMVWLYCFMSS